MDIVLGVSMTPTTVRMVLVEGEKADGVTVDHDVFDVNGGDGSATMSAADQVVAAVLGTQESAAAGGHQLKATGVTWTDHSDASALRDALTAHGIDDVMLVSEGHAAAALAQAVGHAVGYDTTALLFIDRDAATLSVVKTDDGSVVKVLGRSLHSSDAMAVLSEMAAAVDAQDAAPQAMFVVGAGVDVSSVKAHLENLVSLPVSAPDEPELALARGAALAAANAPALEASTVGLAYSQDPDGTTAGSAYAGLAALPTEMAPVGTELDAFESVADDLPVDEGRKPFLLVGSALTSIFVIGVVALVISLAVSIRPTVDQRPAPAQGAVVPAAPVKPAAPAPVPEAQPAPQAPPPAPPPETIKAPIPVVQEAPQPRTVVVDQQPAAVPQAPPPAAPAPAPEAPPPPPPAAPVPVLPAPAPIYNPPGYIPPVVVLPPLLRPPVIDPPRRSPWQPPWQRQPVDEPDYPWQPPSRQNPDYPYPGNSGNGPGDWGPGSSSGGGSGGWNPGSGSGGRGGDNPWNPGGSGGHGNDGGGRGGNGGSSIWPWPFGGGH